MWRKQEVAARAQRAVRPCASGQSASSAPPTVLTPAEPPSSSEPSPPPLTPTKPSPDHSVPAPSEPRPVRPAPTHPWRRPFHPPSFRLAERSGFCKNLTRTPRPGCSLTLFRAFERNQPYVPYKHHYILRLRYTGVITFFTPIFPAKQKEIRAGEEKEAFPTRICPSNTGRWTLIFGFPEQTVSLSVRSGANVH